MSGVEDEDVECNDAAPDAHDDGEKSETALRYTLTNPPPVIFTIGAALQHTLMCVPSFLVGSSLAADIVGAEHDSVIRSKLFSTIIFMSGVCTLLQTAVGARLPMIQGLAAAFLPVLLTAQRSPEWTCTDRITHINSTYNNSTDVNISDGGYTNSTPGTAPMADLPACLTPEDKLREISGSLMAASAVEILIGGTGLVGHLMKFVGPVTVAPTIALVGLSVYKVPIAYTRSSWELALLGLVLTVLFALYLGHMSVPFPTRIGCRAQHKKRKSKTHGVRIFQLLPMKSITFVKSKCHANIIRKGLDKENLLFQIGISLGKELNVIHVKEMSKRGLVLTVLFALYLGHMSVPFPTRIGCRAQHKKRKSKTHGVRIFQLLPVLLSILLVWAVSGILTYTDVFPADPSSPRYSARTDAKSKLIQRTPWFYLPHPGQFGVPSFNIGLFVGFIASFLASIIESVGDYFAAAKACEVSTPPKHAVNRGIFIEGLGGLLSGAVGFGLSTTSYTPNIAAMTMTKTAHRYIMYCAGAVMLLLSLMGKVGAALATMPDPALAGAIVVTCGMMITLGLSTLQYVNMNSSRNLLIIGMALFVGVFLPAWLETYPEDFRTGVKDLDKILTLILGTPMLLGGAIAILLDNTTKGSRKDRGIDAWQNHLDPDVISTTTTHKPMVTSLDNTYGWFWQGRLYQCLPCCSRLPFMPQRTGTDGIPTLSHTGAAGHNPLLKGSPA